MSEIQSQLQAGFMLQGLNQHLSQAIPERLHKYFECWMEDVELTLQPKDQGLGSDIGYMQYTAVFSFEQFPFKKVHPSTVMINVLAWLDDNDELREKFDLAEPRFDIEPESDDTVIMTLEVELIEQLMVIEDPNGDIVWRGKRWINAPYEIWEAEHISIINANNPPSPVITDDQN